MSSLVNVENFNREFITNEATQAKQTQATQPDKKRTEFDNAQTQQAAEQITLQTVMNKLNSIEALLLAVAAIDRGYEGEGLTGSDLMN